jgi:hypothetical protein
LGTVPPSGRFWYFPFSRNGGGSEERGQSGHVVDCVKFLLALDFGTDIFHFLAVDFGTDIFRFLEMVEAMKNVASLDM